MAAADAEKKVQKKLKQLPLSSDLIYPSVVCDDDIGLEKRIKINLVTDHHPTGISEPQVDLEQVKAALPTQITGVAGRGTARETSIQIPVSFEKRERHYGCGGYYYKDYGNVVSGARVEDSQGAEGGGTTSAVVYDNVNDEFAMLASGHVLEPDKKYYQPTLEDSDDVDGTETRNVDCCNEDYGVFADTEGDEFYSSKLAEQDAEINGVVPWTTIYAAHGDSSWTVEKQGSRTGRTQGYIDEIASENRIVWTTNDFYKGDSGGPQYHPTGNYTDGKEQMTYVAIANWFYDPGSCPAPRCAGNSGEHIESEFDVDIY